MSRCYRIREATPVIHASVLRAWGKKIPVAWPRDGRRETLEGHCVVVAITDKLDRREGMVPAELASDDARPVIGEVPPLNGERFFRDGKDATAAERRNALGARLAFMRR